MLRTRSVEVTESPELQLRIAREVLRRESEALEAVANRLDRKFLDAVRLLDESTGSVLVTGMGKAGIVAQKVAATLSSTSTAAHFLHPGEAAHGDLGKVRAGDVVIVFSHSGETSEIAQILEPIKRIGASIIAITSRGQSRLARRADVAIIYGAVTEACPIGMAPSTSCVVMMALGDALAFVLMRRRDFASEDFGRVHPAGSLGKMMQTVDEVMRVGRQLRIAESHRSIAEVFALGQRPGRRSGAIMLVDGSGRLEGLFTDSDLARLFERRDPSLFDRPIGEVMTRNPFTLRTNQRVRDALGLLRDQHISEIPVVDENERPIGMVDITDLVDLIPQAA